MGGASNFTASTTGISSRMNDENVKRVLKKKSQSVGEGNGDGHDRKTAYTKNRKALGEISESALNSRMTEIRNKRADEATTEIYKGKETEDEELSDSENRDDLTEDDMDNVEEEDEAEESVCYVNEPMSPIVRIKEYKEIARAYSRYSRDTLDPDDEDTYDIAMVAEYGNEIFNYLHKLEIKYAPNPHYMEGGTDGISLGSPFNTHELAYRFLSSQTISLSRFQLCGAVALFIAAKYEEITVPTVSQMIYMVGNQFNREEFLVAERFMVEALKFEFNYPGPMSFLRRGSKADDYDSEIRTLAKYFLEITIVDSRFVASPASWLAAGAQYTSRRMLGRGGWTQAHVYYTGYTADQLDPLYAVFVECCLSYKKHHKAIFDKYAQRRFRRSSMYVQEYLKTYYSEK
ncbi:hypothetical protein HII12_001889 [Brettanomyces bruxellensis]|uniref:Cyclin N-terminal domain-containing protein n=1 Tax=Dekkera bruxellensis TaxID=5007 RepID=A0A8H6BKP2_DEKBR|nr:hypothetical protein HII12_001889 [Brettanomyces bruxellensis]